MRKSVIFDNRVKSGKIGNAKSAKANAIRKKGVKLPAVKFLERNVEK